MATQTLFAYVDGSDLDEVVREIERRLVEFVGQTPWLTATPTVVNQRHPDDPTLSPGDLPDWDLGLNLDLPELGGEPPGWFEDIERIARFLGSLHQATARDFIIGIADSKSGIAEDLFCVDTEHPDLEQLRRIIGVETAG